MRTIWEKYNQKLPRTSDETNHIAGCGIRFAAIKLRFKSEEKAREFSTPTLQNEHMALLLLIWNAERFRSENKIFHRSWCMHGLWPLSYLVFGRQETNNIIQIFRDASTELERKDCGNSGTSGVHRPRIPPQENRHRNETVLVVNVNGRRPRYFMHGKKGHQRFQCPPPQKEADGGKFPEDKEAATATKEAITRQRRKKNGNKNGGQQRLSDRFFSYFHLLYDLNTHVHSHVCTHILDDLSIYFSIHDAHTDIHLNINKCSFNVLFVSASYFPHGTYKCYPIFFNYCIDRILWY